MNRLSKGTKAAIFVGIAILVFFGVFVGIMITQDMGKTEEQKRVERIEKNYQNLLSQIKVVNVNTKKAPVDDTDTLSDQEELPDISKYPLSVDGTMVDDADVDKLVTVEIFSSPEKAGKGTDGWLNDAANAFNREKFTVNGKRMTVSIRSVSSGLAMDYITTGKYVPDAISPSNVFWGSMLDASHVKTTLIEKKLCGNVAGILLSNSKYQEIYDKYGSASMSVIAKTTAGGELLMGYTNPFISSTGLNFLVNTLYTYDSENLLSTAATDGFKLFQENVPLVSYNTLQMRKAAESGSLDAMVMEYQQYYNDSSLKNFYRFTPFGVRHDNPLYALGDLSQDKLSVLKKFAEYCLSEEQQRSATACGFNQNESYRSELPDNIAGDVLLAAQKLYKENKNSGKEIIAVFVADVSGSMSGEPLNSLKTSLINSMRYINKEHYVGLISYSNDVYLNLPIGKFDLNQQALFKGAVLSLDANGQTATNDALLVALDMIQKQKTDMPDAKPMIFLLSDGAQNRGANLNDIEDILREHQVPVYTIGYNADIDALKRISEINEAATINAESDDIVYQLKNLFNSEM